VLYQSYPLAACAGTDDLVATDGIPCEHAADEFGKIHIVVDDQHPVNVLSKAAQSIPKAGLGDWLDEVSIYR